MVVVGLHAVAWTIFFLAVSPLADIKTARFNFKAPRAKNLRAAWYPRPALEPVTRTVLPEKEIWGSFGGLFSPQQSIIFKLEGGLVQWVIWFEHRRPLWRVVLGALHRLKGEFVFDGGEMSLQQKWENWWQYAVWRKALYKWFPILLRIVGFLILWYLFGPDEPLLARSPFDFGSHLQPEAEKRSYWTRTEVCRTHGN